MGFYNKAIFFPFFENQIRDRFTTVSFTTPFGVQKNENQFLKLNKYYIKQR